MNNKLIKASVAGAAAIALAAGGGTFAAWNDNGAVAGATEAGFLELALNSSGQISNIGAAAIAPGEYRTIDMVLTSATFDGIDSADLSMVVEDLVDEENGCENLNSEKQDDPTCDVAGDEGEFSKKGYVRVRWSEPEPASGISMVGNNCQTTNPVGANNVLTTLDALQSDFALENLESDEGLCVRLDIGLAQDADNSMQGDKSTFNMVFNLDQAFD